MDVQNGNIGLGLPADASFEIDAIVDVGDIDDGGFGFEIERHVVGESALDTVGQGGADVVLSVAVGGIELRQL